MNRLIPGKTKVQVELFRGVTIGDVIIAGIGMAMLILVLLSSLPCKLAFCIGVIFVAVLLLVRLDDRANYLFLFGILVHFTYKRRFARIYTDDMLLKRAEGTEDEAAFHELFDEPERPKETPKERKLRRKAEAAARKEEERDRKREDKLLKSKKISEEEKQAILQRRAEEAERELTEDIKRTVAEAKDEQEKGENLERKVREKARAKVRKEEDRILRSKRASEEEKQAIRDRRAREAREAAIKLAEYKDANAKRAPMKEIIAFSDIRDGYIEYGKQYFGGVIEIDPVEFRFFSEHRRRSSVENGVGRILRSLHGKFCANIVKLDRPVNYDRYLEREQRKVEDLRASFESGILSEEEYQVRLEIEYDRINELRDLCFGDKVIDSYYYVALFDSDKRRLDLMLKDAEANLRQGELNIRRLNTKELAVFLKYTYAIDFDEREVDAVRPEDYAEWAKPDVVDIKARRVEINHIVTHNYRVVNYPTVVGDAWLAGVMSIPGTKVVLKCRPMDRDKAIRGIDRSLMELRGQWSATGIDSKKLEIEEHLATLQELLTTLQGEGEVLLETNVYITAYDIVATRNNLSIPQPPRSELIAVSDMKKTVRRSWQEMGFRLNNMEFEQASAFVGAQISAYDPMAKMGRGIPSNTIAACYPWIYAHISDEGGIKLGESAGVPVFINFFRRDSERVNSNMVIVGKSGSGKSYATKSLLLNLAAEDAKIFILDPENEYTELAHNLHGKFINVANSQYGRLNPFQIITALDDDEAEGERGGGNSYATHLQFLEEFFKQILPDCDKDALEYLNNMVDRIYANRGITPETNLSKLTPEDYPIFDELQEAIVAEYQKTDNQYLRTMLRTLLNYIAKFSTGGRNATIWNGPSTITTDENFTVFNFQSMLANRNTTVANAQMLLVLKYIDNEIIKNRDYNMKYGLNRKVVVVIDEAHVFIDTKFPIALDFMFQLAKRIRKYNGMQIVITQNIKDFVGSEEIARKSTAIINACQYSFIFSLAPNDMQDLVKLYENAGGINEIEQEQIIQAPRGQAFTIMSPTSRSTFRVDTPKEMTQLFEQRDYVSHYFSSEEGQAVWEDFVAESRELHDRNAPETRAETDWAQVWGEEDAPDEAKPSVVMMEEISAEEYDAQREQKASAMIEEIDAAGTVATLPPDAPAYRSDGGNVDRLIDALSGLVERLNPEPAGSTPPPAPAPAAEASGADAALLEELAALRAQNERLQQQNMQLQDKLMAQFEERESAVPESKPEDAGVWASVEESAAEPETQESSGGLWSQLFSTAADDEKSTYDTGYGEESGGYGDEDSGYVDDAWADALSEDTPDEWDTVESESAEELGEEDSALMRSLKLLSGMTAFDRMRVDGETRMEITLDELSAQIDADRKDAQGVA